MKFPGPASTLLSAKPVLQGNVGCCVLRQKGSSIRIISAHVVTQAHEENEVNQDSGFQGSWFSGFPDFQFPGFPEFRGYLLFFCFKRLTIILVSGCFWKSSRTYCMAQRMMSCFDAFMSSSRRSWSFISSMPSYSPSVMRKVSLMVGLSLMLNKKLCCAACTGPASRTPVFPDSRIPGVSDSRKPGLPDSRSSDFPDSRTPGLL